MKIKSKVKNYLIYFYNFFLKLFFVANNFLKLFFVAYKKLNPVNDKVFDFLTTLYLNLSSIKYKFFQQKITIKNRILLCGNVANNLYRMVKVLRNINIKADLVISDYFDFDFFSRPFSLDNDFNFSSSDNHNMKKIKNKEKGFVIPNYVKSVGKNKIYFKGSLISKCINFQKYFYKETGKKLSFFKSLVLINLGLYEFIPILILIYKNKYDYLILSYNTLPLGIFIDIKFSIFPVGGDHHLYIKQKTLMGKIYRLSYLKSDKILIGTNNSYADIYGNLKNYKSKHIFFPLIYNEKDFKIKKKDNLFFNLKKFDSNKIIIGNLCRQNWKWKKNYLILNTLKKLPDRFILLLIEWGDDVQRSKDFIKKNSLGKRIIWFSPCSKVRLNKIISVCDLIVDQFSMNSISATCVESMFNKKPVICKYFSKESHPVLNLENETEIKNFLTNCSKKNLKKIGNKSYQWIKSKKGESKIQLYKDFFCN